MWGLAGQQSQVGEMWEKESVLGPTLGVGGALDLDLGLVPCTLTMTVGSSGRRVG